MKFIFNQKKLLISLFVLSVLVSLTFLLVLGKMGHSQHQEPATDYRNCYKPFARSLLQGELVYISQFSDICSPPGYPIFLAIALVLSDFLNVNELTLVVIFNVLLTAGSVIFLFLIAQTLFNRKIALLSSFLWISYPFSLWFLKNPNTEAPFIFFLFLAIWLYLISLKEKRLNFIFASGFILGLSILVRPYAFLLPLLLALMVFFLIKDVKKTKFFLAAVLLAGALIPISIWEIMVFNKTNQLIFLASSGAPSLADGLTFALKSGAGGDKIIVSPDVLSLMERAKELKLNSLARIFQFSVYELINNPSAFLELILLKLGRSWYATSQMWWEGKILIVQLFYLLPALFGAIFAFLKLKEKLGWIIFVLVVIFYFWLIALSALSILRYMVPAMPLVIIFSAIAINFIFKKCLGKLS